MLNFSNSEGRCARWRLRLSEFYFEVKYKPGAANAVADSMSRMNSTAEDTSPLDEGIPRLLLDLWIDGPVENWLDFDEERIDSFQDD